jgi:murein hydrolase activator
MLRLTHFLCIIWLCCLSMQAAVAGNTASDSAIEQSPEDKQQTEKQLQALQNQIKSLKKRLKTTKKKATQAERNLRNTELEISKSSKVLRETEKKIRDTDFKLRQLRNEEAGLEKSKQQQLEALAKQIRSAYATGRQEYLKLLLTQENPAILGRALTMYQYLNQARNKEIVRLQVTIQQLEKVQGDIIAQLDSLKNLYVEQKLANESLVKLKTERKKMVARLNRQLNSSGKKLTNMLEDEKQLKQVIEELTKVMLEVLPQEKLSGLLALKGRLSWPARGKIIHRYGAKRNQRGSRWNGVVLKAVEGSEVNAIHHGRVVFADWMRGLGLLTIVDHGEGYMSLYAYNQSLLKSVGERVEAGEPIATVGQSGGQSDSGVYFEIRHNSKPINPSKWIR